MSAVAVEFVLPDVGEGIDAGEIVEWHVAAGDQVAEHQPLVDVQTDKAIVTIPCPVTGTVVELGGEPGDRVAVGAILAVFEGEDRATVTSPAAAPPTPVPVSMPGNGATAPRDLPSRPLASPAVRQLARSSGLDLGSIAGSGPGGRITREDVEAALTPRPASAPIPPLPSPPTSPPTSTPTSPPTSPPAAPLPPPAATPPPPPAAAGQVVPLRGTRRAIAHALTRAWQTIPHMIDYREVDATALMATQAAVRKRAKADGNDALARAMTVTPLVVKMVAAVLPRHPYANASIDLEREEISLHPEYNIGVAVAAPQGLVVPVVRAADTKPAGRIAIEIAELTAAARENRLTPEQLGGATFTVNNYGALGVWLGTPIIAPGQVVNFGIGRLEQRPVVRDGQIVARPILPLAVSGDHRVLDGHTLAALVNDVIELMEAPGLLAAELR